VISIVLDTETTGLLLPKTADLDKQPCIIELAMAKFENGKLIGEFSELIDPEREFDPIITKITGIKPEDLIGKPKFRQLLPKIEDFMAGADVLYTHNAPFDKGMLENELERCARTGFPWPERTVCTVQEFLHLKGFRLKLPQLYELKLNKVLQQSHRAMDDVMALAEILLVEGML
jgi:DNA polymerase III epsilon subunit family exonuclease